MQDTACRLKGGGTKQLKRSIIHLYDAPIRVNGDDAFSHIGENGVQLVALAAKVNWRLSNVCSSGRLLMKRDAI